MLMKMYLRLSFMVRVLGSKILRFVELINLKAEWALKNPNNKTYPVSYFPIDLVHIGDYSYGPIDLYTYGAEGEGLEVGKYCSIAKDVKFVLGGNHKTDCLMTFPVKNIFGKNQENESLTKGKIILEDDVWIGVGSTILSGIRLGQGCIVAARSVVTKSFPPYAIIGGNPARIIKMRFDENVIKALENSAIHIGSIDSKEIIDNIEYYSDTLNEKTVRDLIFHLKK
jgi:acetyltransferase-like isoleucine patch superfamily enzyme